METTQICDHLVAHTSLRVYIKILKCYIHIFYKAAKQPLSERRVGDLSPFGWLIEQE